MRIFEIILFIIAILYAFTFIKDLSKKIKILTFLPLLMFAFLIIHMVVEKTRWQMIPLYLLTILNLIYFLKIRSSDMDNKSNHLKSKSKIESKSKFKGIIVSLMFLLILVSGFASYILPVDQMPNPTGDFEIGTESFDLIDPDRAAIYSSNLNNKRKIKAQVWYPSDETKGLDRVPWIEDGKIVARYLALDMKLPYFALDQSAIVLSHSFKEADVSSKLDKYPVIIISHGWKGFRNLHTDVAEELASNGYIVIAIDHTYGSVITVFNEGEKAPVNYDALPKRDKTPDFLDYANKLVKTYAGDVKLLLNEMEITDKSQINPRLRSKFDLTQIGLLGHSTGGGGDVFTAITDERIKSLVGMDAWVEPIESELIDKGLKIPSLFMRSGDWEVGYNNANLLKLIEVSKGQSQLFQINGTMHSDFTMAYMYSPLTKYTSITGELDGRISSKIQREFILKFFNKTLKGEISIDISEIDDHWEEVWRVK
jgi:hypothetical protein